VLDTGPTKLTVAEYVPVAEMALELRYVVSEVTVPEAMFRVVPVGNVAVAIVSVTTGPFVGDTGNPEPETRTEVPTTPEDGDTLTVGATTVKVTSCGTALPSDIWTVC
jgi:hypothetical protein